jgi:transposase
MVELASDFGYRNIGFLLDRGYFSKRNIEYFRKKGYEYIMMMKDNNQCVQKAVNEIRIKLRNMEGYYIAEHEVCGATVNGELFSGDEKKVYFHVYYDDIRAGEEKRAYLNLLSAYERELERKVERKIAVEGELKKYKRAFKLKYDINGYFIGYQRDRKHIEEELNKKGYFTIVTSEKKEATEVLDIYRGRDNIEKMFRTLKSGIDFNKYRVYSDAALQSKVFITFIAMIIRNEIFQKLEKLRKTNKKYFTVPAVIYELENIEITRNNEGRYTRRYALTAKQKQILKQFDIDEKYIEREISNINSRMS